MAADADAKAVLPGALVYPVRDLVARLQMVPYVEGQGTFAGADCWGIVEIWYREWLGVGLPNRGAIAPGPAGLAAGFDTVTNFEPIATPVNHCLAVMRSAGFVAGHIGVVWNHGVIHSEKRSGCVWQRLDNRALASRITCFLGYRAA